MKTVYSLLTVFLILIAPFGSRAQCTGNFTPAVNPSIGTCGSGDIECIAGETLTIDLLITDANNDVVTLSITNLPASATVSQTLPYAAQTPYTVTITWIPAVSEIGVDQEVTCLVIDPCTGTTCDLTLLARNPCDVNSTPSIDPSISVCGGQIDGVIGQTNTIDLLIEDSDGDSITLKILSAYPLPASATVSPALPYKGQTPYTVTITWNPTVSEYLSHPDVRFQVLDSCTGTNCELTFYAACSLPTIVCPSDITQAADQSGCTAAVFYSATGDGLPAPDIEYSIPSGSSFALGTTPVTATATNSCGTASCTFNVTVTPAAPPQINCPSDVTIPAEASGCNGYYVPFITASSPVGLASLSANPPGPLFPAGTTTVEATAIDSCGTTATCSFNVTVSSGLSVDAGTDVSTIFGYASTQTATRTAIVSGGTGTITYSWTLSRPLKCNQVNSSGDELFTGGSCTNNICGSGSATPAAPSCSGSATINATLLADAEVCVTVTDANGCTATDCFNITAIDGRCFTGNAGKNKAKICHQTGSASNPWVNICIAKNTANQFIANHPGDYLGPCNSRIEGQDSEEENFLFASPNPFTNSTTIQFTLPENDYASVKVFDVTGREIETLYDGNAEANHIYELTFDGRRFSNGIYFLLLNTQGRTNQTRKLILNK